MKYKKILEKNKKQGHKPSKEHLMFGVVPNWLDEKNGKKSITKEKLIVDHLIKNIGSSVSGNA